MVVLATLAFLEKFVKKEIRGARYSYVAKLSNNEVVKIKYMRIPRRLANVADKSIAVAEAIKSRIPVRFVKVETKLIETQPLLDLYEVRIRTKRKWL